MIGRRAKTNARMFGLGLALALFGAGMIVHEFVDAGSAAMWQWSKTAATNAIADPTVNWAEGMPPAVVNDSARAMMARLAEFRDDTSGLLVTAGTSTAYTLATNQGLQSTPNDGQLVAFSPHVGNGASPTLQVDSGNTYPLQTNPGAAVPAAVLIQGTPYFAKFSASAAAWILGGFYGSPSLVPVGAVLDYTGATAPNSNFALPFGQAISRTSFPVYFALVGTTYGAGDGSTTFNIPDLRGRMVAGVDNMGGSAAGRISVAGGNFDGTVLGGNGGAQNHTLTTAELAVHSHANSLTDPGHTHPQDSRTMLISGGGGALAGSPNVLSSGGTTQSATTGISITNANAGSGNAHTILSPAMTLTKIVRIQHHDDRFASEMCDVACNATNDNDEIWFKPARAAAERW